MAGKKKASPPLAVCHCGHTAHAHASVGGPVGPISAGSCGKCSCPLFEAPVAPNLAPSQASVDVLAQYEALKALAAATGQPVMVDQDGKIVDQAGKIAVLSAGNPIFVPTIGVFAPAGKYVEEVVDLKIKKPAPAQHLSFSFEIPTALPVAQFEPTMNKTPPKVFVGTSATIKLTKPDGALGMPEATGVIPNFTHKGTVFNGNPCNEVSLPVTVETIANAQVHAHDADQVVALKEHVSNAETDEDVAFFQKKLHAALGIPKKYLGGNGQSVGVEEQFEVSLIDGIVQLDGVPLAPEAQGPYLVTPAKGLKVAEKLALAKALGALGWGAVSKKTGLKGWFSLPWIITKHKAGDLLLGKDGEPVLVDADGMPAEGKSASFGVPYGPPVLSSDNPAAKLFVEDLKKVGLLDEGVFDAAAKALVPAGINTVGSSVEVYDDMATAGAAVAAITEEIAHQEVANLKKQLKKLQAIDALVNHLPAEVAGIAGLSDKFPMDPSKQPAMITPAEVPLPPPIPDAIGQASLALELLHQYIKSLAAGAKLGANAFKATRKAALLFGLEFPFPLFSAAQPFKTVGFDPPDNIPPAHSLALLEMLKTAGWKVATHAGLPQVQPMPLPTTAVFDLEQQEQAAHDAAKKPFKAGVVSMIPLQSPHPKVPVNGSGIAIDGKPLQFWETGPFVIVPPPPWQENQLGLQHWDIDKESNKAGWVITKAAKWVKVEGTTDGEAMEAMPKTAKKIEVDEQGEPKVILAYSILKISEALQELKTSGLNESAIIVLLRDMLPKDKKGNLFPKSDIKAVLDALAALKSTYCA